MAGMATSWRTGRQHLNQTASTTARTTACSQSTSGPVARFPRRARACRSCRSGFTCPPHQAVAPSQATAVRLSEQAAAGKSTTAFGPRDHRRAVVKSNRRERCCEACSKGWRCASRPRCLLELPMGLPGGRGSPIGQCGWPWVRRGRPEPGGLPAWRPSRPIHRTPPGQRPAQPATRRASRAVR